MSKKLKKAVKSIKSLEEHISFLSEELRVYKRRNVAIEKINKSLERETDLLNARVRQLQDPEVISSYVHKALIRVQELDSEK
jgi:peptidoglycan hydrolase CwlO-like protein